MRLALWFSVLCLMGMTARRVVFADETPPARVPRIATKGPDGIPDQLSGRWKISLCVNVDHAWIRFENLDTAEVHTLSRFQKWAGKRVQRQTGEILVPAVRESGLSWDRDLSLEEDVRRGRFVLLSTVVQDPAVYKGKDGGRGYSVWSNTCVTYTRDAWRHYTGQFYRLEPLAAPLDLAVAVSERYPQVSIKERIN